jgi:hypothetical protein
MQWYQVCIKVLNNINFSLSNNETYLSREKV